MQEGVFLKKARKLPSGKYNKLVYIGKDDNGKRKYHSVTADTIAEVELLAAQFKLSKKVEAKNGLTFKQGLENYIQECEGICSPTTLRGYKSYQKSKFDDINDIYINELTNDDIQKLIKKHSKKLSAKTVRNIIGLITPVLEKYRPEFKVNVKLPAKEKPDYYIPTDNDIEFLISSLMARDDEEAENLLNAILIAAFGSLRRSEVCGLRDCDVMDDFIIIRNVRIVDENNNVVDKTKAKNYTSKRIVELPESVMNRIKDKKGYIVDMNPDEITRKFRRYLMKLDIPFFRFHDLRHYCATIMHSINFPIKYSMARGGWKSSKTLEEIYTHTLDDKTKKLNKKLNKHFDNVYDASANKNARRNARRNSKSQ